MTSTRFQFFRICFPRLRLVARWRHQTSGYTKLWIQLCHQEHIFINPKFTCRFRRVESFRKCNLRPETTCRSLWKRFWKHHLKKKLLFVLGKFASRSYASTKASFCQKPSSAIDIPISRRVGHIKLDLAGSVAQNYQQATNFWKSGVFFWKQIRIFAKHRKLLPKQCAQKTHNASNIVFLGHSRFSANY